MKQILHIEERTTGNELAGEPPETWTRVTREWFDVEPLTGREYIQAQQVQSSVSHKMRSPYLGGMHSGMRLTAGENAAEPSRVFNVASVVNVGENNRELEWMAEEVVSG
jgi:SPP1 family predicted phage head-tail adaptor